MQRRKGGGREEGGEERGEQGWGHVGRVTIKWV